MADDIIEPHCLPPELGRSAQATGPYLQIRVGTKVADVERRLILATLEQCGGTKEKAAAMLGISLKTLYNRLREYEAQKETASQPDSALREPH
jgi:DNA-binding NtrC family response regulator